MAGSILVQSQVLRDTATEIRSINNDLENKLIEINTAMNNLESSWVSEASTEIRAAMNALKPVIEQYKGVVNDYAKFLDTTAQSYETTESSVHNSAAAFK